MSQQPLAPDEAERLDKMREDHRGNQPYASELDDRELERAHKEGRPAKSDPAPVPDKPGAA